MYNKNHLWIPESEVQKVDKKLQGRTKPRNIQHSEHGAKLGKSLSELKDVLDKAREKDSLKDLDLMIFKVELPEGEKVKDKENLFKSNGLNVKVVKTENKAIVSTTKSEFDNLRKRVNNYTNSGEGKTHFDYVDDFKPYIGSEKNSDHLQKTIVEDKLSHEVDVQLMLMPNLSEDNYKIILSSLVGKVQKENGKLKSEPYYLSDNTPIIRAVIPSQTLELYENDSAIYRIEETDFFHSDSANKNSLDLKKLLIDPNVDIPDLPLVAVLDSGVKFPSGLESLIHDVWKDDNSTGGDYEHGTKVASRICFGYIVDQLQNRYVLPQARIVDCQVLDGSVPVDVFIKRIQKVALNYSEVCKVYNLSANTNIPIEGDEMSIVGYELDVIQKKYNIQFIISAGNHQLANTQYTLEDILDDDESRISPPADSMLGICVGAISGESHPNTLSNKNEITSYSRRGPGFNGFIKPDLVAYAGEISNVMGSLSVPEDKFSLMLDKNGKLSPDAGTSFSAPIVAGMYARILQELPQTGNVLLAKALMYHSTKPIWDDEELSEDELIYAHNIYGRGLPTLEESLFSSNHKVTFVRTGTLNKITKERVTIYMPELLAAQVGRNIARVSVTCLTMPNVDRTKGTEYLGAYVRASLKKSGQKEDLLPVSPDFKEGRVKWDCVQQFSKVFSKFNSGDWQVWLELFSRWELENEDVEYALVVTIEDISGSLDIYNEILLSNRYRPLNEIRVRI